MRPTRRPRGVLRARRRSGFGQLLPDRPLVEGGHPARSLGDGAALAARVLHALRSLGTVVHERRVRLGLGGINVDVMQDARVVLNRAADEPAGGLLDVAAELLQLREAALHVLIRRPLGPMARLGLPAPREAELFPEPRVVGRRPPGLNIDVGLGGNERDVGPDPTSLLALAPVALVDGRRLFERVGRPPLRSQTTHRLHRRQRRAVIGEAGELFEPDRIGDAQRAHRAPPQIGQRRRDQCWPNDPGAASCAPRVTRMHTARSAAQNRFSSGFLCPDLTCRSIGYGHRRGCRSAPVPSR